MTAAASGTMVWAWMSTVLTRLPLTTTSRRLPCPTPGPGVPEALDRLHPTNARPANAPAINSPEIGLSVLLDHLLRSRGATYTAWTYSASLARTVERRHALLQML